MRTVLKTGGDVTAVERQDNVVGYVYTCKDIMGLGIVHKELRLNDKRTHCMFFQYKMLQGGWYFPLGGHPLRRICRI